MKKKINYIVSIGNNQKDDNINEYKLNENLINVYREKFLFQLMINFQLIFL